ncbi:MAG: hypothetical protein QI199_03000, partial [Candidatus Korarchaeota archaeon]|nr:hypothetical protein [Candidatus Korarchaeota archaeon]
MRPFVILCLLMLAASSIMVGAQQTLPPEYNPLVYERLDVVVRALPNGSALVEFTAALRNEGKVMVVPGYGLIPLTVSQRETFLGLPLPSEKTSNGSISILEAENLDTGRKMEALIITKNGTRAIRYSLWQPLKPGDVERIRLIFRIDGAIAKGVLFDEMDFSLGPLSNTVKEGTLRVIPPPNQRITFSDPPLEGGSWDISGTRSRGSFKISVEFSR